MGRIFNFDGPVFHFLELFANLVILNLLTILLCIPVITGGAAITALHYTVLHMVRDTDNYIVRNFFRAFKENFRRGTILWLPVLGLIAAIALNAWLIRHNAGAFPPAAKIVFGVGFLLILFVMVWIFPLLCHFEYAHIGAYIRNASLLAVGHLPRTAAMVAITAVPLVFVYMQPYRSIAWLVLFGFSLPAWGKAWLYSPVFKKMEPEEIPSGETEEESAEESADESAGEPADEPVKAPADEPVKAPADEPVKAPADGHEKKPAGSGEEDT